MTDDIEAKLAALRDASEPMPRALRARILADARRVAPRPAARTPRWMVWTGIAGLPAATLAGLVIGLSQPSLVWEAVPGLTGTDALIEEVFDAAPLAGEAA